MSNSLNWTPFCILAMIITPNGNLLTNDRLHRHHQFHAVITELRIPITQWFYSHFHAKTQSIPHVFVVVLVETVLHRQSEKSTVYTVGVDNKLTIHYFTDFCIYLLCSYYFMLLLFLEYTTSNLKRTGSKIQCCVVHWCLAVKYYAVL